MGVREDSRSVWRERERHEISVISVTSATSVTSLISVTRVISGGGGCETCGPPTGMCAATGGCVGQAWGLGFVIWGLGFGV